MSGGVILALHAMKFCNQQLQGAWHGVGQGRHREQARLPGLIEVLLPSSVVALHNLENHQPLSMLLL